MGFEAIQEEESGFIPIEESSGFTPVENLPALEAPGEESAIESSTDSGIIPRAGRVVAESALALTGGALGTLPATFAGTVKALKHQDAALYAETFSDVVASFAFPQTSIFGVEPSSDFKQISEYIGIPIQWWRENVSEKTGDWLLKQEAKPFGKFTTPEQEIAAKARAAATGYTVVEMSPWMFPVTLPLRALELFTSSFKRLPKKPGERFPDFTSEEAPQVIKDINSGKIILGRDERPFEAASQDWIKEVGAKAGDRHKGPYVVLNEVAPDELGRTFEVERYENGTLVKKERYADKEQASSLYNTYVDTLQLQDSHKPLFKIKEDIKDLPEFSSFEWANPEIIFSAKSVASIHKNPVLKWVADQTYQSNLAYRQHADQLLYSPKLEFKGNRPVSIHTENGFKTAFEALPFESQLKLKRFIDEADAAGVDMSLEPGTAQRMGLSPKEHRVLQLHRNMLDNAALTYNRSSSLEARGEYEAIKLRAGYTPHIFEGDFKVFVRLKQGDILAEVGSAKTKRQAEKLKERLTREYAGTATISDIKYIQRKAGSDPVIDAFSSAISHAKLNSNPEAAAQLQAIMKDMRAKGFAVHTKERSGVGGYLGDRALYDDPKKEVADWMKAQETYLHGALRSAYNKQLKAKTRELFENPTIRRELPNTRNYAEFYLDRTFNRFTKFDEIASMGLNWAFGTGSQSLSEIFSPLTKAVLYNKLFFHKVSYLYASAVQPLQIIPAKLVELNSTGIKGDIASSVVSSYKDLVVPSKEHKEAFKIFADRDLVAPQFLKQFEEDVFTKTPEARKKLVADVALGKFEAALFEEYTRLQAGTMFYNYLRSSGVSPKIAATSAADLANYYMVEYASVSRPLLYSTGATGFAGQFKTFQSNYLAQTLEYALTAKNTKDIRPLLSFLGTSIATHGVKGAILVTEYDAIISAFNKASGQSLPTATEFMLENMPEVLTNGPVQSAAGIVIPSVEAPNLSPADLFAVPQFSFALEAGASAIPVLTAAVHPDKPVNKYELKRFLKAIAPSSFGGWIDEAIETGQITLIGPDEPYLIHNPKYKNTAEFWRNKHGTAAAKLGFKDIDEVRIATALNLYRTAEKNLEANTDSLAKVAAYSALNGIPLSADWFYNKAEELGLDWQTFHEKVKSAAKNQEVALIDRTINIKTKAGKRAAAQLDRLIGETTMREQEKQGFTPAE